MNTVSVQEKSKPVILKQIIQVMEEEKEVLGGLLKFAEKGSHLEEERTGLVSG